MVDASREEILAVISEIQKSVLLIRLQCSELHNILVKTSEGIGEGKLNSLGDFGIVLATNKSTLEAMAEISKYLENGVDKQDSINKRLKKIMNAAMMHQGIDKFNVCFYNFSIGIDYIPILPKDGTEEWKKLYAWLVENNLEFLIEQKASFSKLKKLCKEYAEKGMPLPPEIEAIPIPTITMRKSK